MFLYLDTERPGNGGGWYNSNRRGIKRITIL